MRRFVYLCAALGWLLVPAIAQASPIEIYRTLLADYSAALSEQNEHFQSDPDSYWAMVQQRLLPLWSKRASLEGLATSEKVNALTEDQRQRLDAVLDDTVQRYAFEILENYSGQRFVLNAFDTDPDNPQLAVLDITAVWDNFPDLDIELMLVQEGEVWRFYNIRYGWFSYIGAKKWSYRRGLTARRFDDFVDHLAEKNQRHFAKMCSEAALQSSDICRDWQVRSGFD